MFVLFRNARGERLYGTEHIFPGRHGNIDEPATAPAGVSTPSPPSYSPRRATLPQSQNDSDILGVMECDCS